ncbi:hypothetical protein ACR0ST_12840 [Aliidiomarina sp. Khilg15.8]
MTSARKLIVPVVVAAAALLFVVAAWFPGEQTSSVQQRPTLLLTLQYDESNAQLQPMVDDIIYRLRTHHEYNLRQSPPSDPATQVLPVSIQVLQRDGLIHMRADVVGERIAVNGAPPVAHNLPAKLFSLINDSLQPELNQHSTRR